MFFKIKRNIILSKGLLFFFLINYTAPILIYNVTSNKFLIFYLFLTYIVSAVVLFFSSNTPQNANSLNIPKSGFALKICLLFFIYFTIFYFTKENYISLFNRNTRESEFIQGNIYVVLDIFIRVIFTHLIFSVYPSKNYLKKSIISILILFSALFDIGYLGARRTFIFIFLNLIWYFLPKLNPKKILLLFVLLFTIGIINFLFSGYRELVFAGYSDFGIQETIVASFITNEFQLVSENFLNYQTYAQKFGFGFGETILKIPLTFIPRFLWVDKPQTIDKITGIFPNMVGELFYNFGYGLLIFLEIYFIVILKLIRVNKKYSIFVFALLPELFRTTVSNFILSIVLYIMIDKLLNLKLTFK